MNMVRGSAAVVALSASVAASCGGTPGEEVGSTSQSTAAITAANGTPVSLLQAEASWTLGSPEATPSHLVARINVANLAYQKHVWIRYHVANGSQVVQDWTDLDATWMNGDDWAVSTPVFNFACPQYCANLSYEFAVAYEVNGNTYWDNNGGWNYLVATDVEPIGTDPGPPAILGAEHVMLSQASWASSSATLSGRVILDNLAYQKNVDVLYSTDGWKTDAWASAQYSQWTTHGIEYWSFAIPMPAGASHVDFAIRYEVAGQTYWDNNLGLNYGVNPS